MHGCVRGYADVVCTYRRYTHTSVAALLQHSTPEHGKPTILSMPCPLSKPSIHIQLAELNEAHPIAATPNDVIKRT